MFQVWGEQKLIGWQQIFKGSLSNKWAQVQRDLDAREIERFSASSWASKIVGILIEMSLKLWVTRDK